MTDKELIREWLLAQDRAADALSRFAERLAEETEAAAFQQLQVRGVQLVDPETLKYTPIVKQVLQQLGK